MHVIISHLFFYYFDPCQRDCCVHTNDVTADVTQRKKFLSAGIRWWLEYMNPEESFTWCFPSSATSADANKLSFWYTWLSLVAATPIGKTLQYFFIHFSWSDRLIVFAAKACLIFEMFLTFVFLSFSLQHGLYRLGLLCASVCSVRQHTKCGLCLWR